MKLKYLIVILVITQLILRISPYTMLALGDTGQVDSWWQQNQKLRIINLLHDHKDMSEVNKKSLREYTKMILDEMLADKNLNVEDQVAPTQVFKNFGSYFKCSFLPPSIDSIVLLGDGIYTEHKAKGKIISSSFTIKDAPFENDPNDRPTILDGRSGRGYYVNFGTEAFGRITEVLDKRIQYAAYKLGHMIGQPEGGTCFTGGNDKVIVLPGNHAFDVDQGLEEALIASQFKKVNADAPNLDVEISPNGKNTIVSLDVSMMHFACLDKARFMSHNPNYDPLLNLAEDETLYLSCTKGEGGSRTLKTPQQAREYLLKVVALLVEIKNKQANWRILRTHNPLFNPEVDFNALLQLKLKIKCNGKDLSLLWNENIQGSVTCIFDPQAGVIPLTKVIRNAGIDFFLVSHFHAAMFVAAPWADNYANGGFNGNPSGLRCINRFNEFFDLVDPGVKSTIPIQPTADNCKTTIDNTIILEAAGTPQNIYLSFIIGNSGRYLDPIPLDTKSNGHIVWARSTTEKYIDQEVGSLKNLNVVELSFPNAQTAKESVEGMWNTIRDSSRPSYGWTVLNFAEDGTKVDIEFYELPHGGVKQVLTNKFTLQRRPAGNTKVHKIETMPQKYQVSAKKLKIKKNK